MRRLMTPNLVSRGGLVRCGASPALNVAGFAAGMVGGGDSIVDLGAPRGALLYRPRSGQR
jgi:hypothetical protein